jgi:hypothetical protein
VDVEGSFAYFISWSKLQVLDVSHKENPQLKGSLTLGLSGLDLCVSGSSIYVVTYQYYPSQSYNLQIINVSDKNSPTFVNSFTLDTSSGYYPYDLFVSGNYAYIAEGKGLQIVDVSNPNNLHEEARLDTIGADGIFISNQLAYAIAFYTFWIADVSNPNNPKFKGQCYTYGWGESVYGLGKIAYVADGPYGLTIINASDEQNPDIIGKYNMPYLTFDVQVVGNYAFTANGSAGLQIVDISDKTKPNKVGEYDTPGWSQGVFVRDTLAYVADDYNGLQIINVSNPTAPKLVGNRDTPGNAQDVYISGNYAYIADLGSGLQILNVANPSAPSYVGSYITPGVNAHAVFVKDNIAYVAVGDSGLQIINVANPSNPSRLGIYRKIGYAYDVFVRDSLAYVAGDSLYILSISHPSNPRLVDAVCSGYGAGSGICVTGNYAYVTSSAGVSLVDVSDPSNMQLLEKYDTPGMAEGVSVSNGYVYVADWFSLMILKCGEVVPQTVQVNSPNGGENWCAGSTHNITWSCSGMDHVKIEYSTDGGSTWMTIIGSSPCASKSYSWNIPDTISTNCLVRIGDEADNSPCDYSNSKFTISRKPDAVELFSPSNKTVEVPTEPVHLKWSTAQGADSYHLQVDNDSIFKSLVYEKYGITETQYYVPGLDSGITYYWRVSASNECGAGEWSSVWYFTAGAEALAQVMHFSPADQESVDYKSGVAVTFSKSMDRNTINRNSVSIKGLKNYNWNFVSEDHLTFLFTPDSGFYSLDTVTVILTGKIKDTHGRGLDLDGDGVANDSNKFITRRFYVFPLGDYNEDMMVNSDDIIGFTNAWNTQDTSNEIGPATGTPPHLLPSPDGKVDFEDLVIFVWMWNWFHQKTSLFPSVWSQYESTDFNNLAGFAPDSLIGQNETKEFGLVLKDVKDVMVVSILIVFDPAKLQVESAGEGSLLSKEGAKTLFLRSINNEKGIVEIASSRLKGNPRGVEGTDAVALICSSYYFT